MRHAILNRSRTSRKLGRGLAVTLVGLMISGTSVHTASAHESTTLNFPGTITIEGGKLTTKIPETSLQKVMEEISKTSGIQVRWLDTAGEERVAVDFVAVPLSRAIPRLLSDRNFVLFYSSAGEEVRLTQVWISSRKKEVEHLEDHAQPISQKLPLLAPSEADPTEEEFVPPDTLLQTALYDRGSAARLEAITRLEEYATQDPRIAAAFSHLAQQR